MNDRQIRGIAIISKGDVPKILGENTWRIPSQTGEGNYLVTRDSSGYVGSHHWICDCKDHTFET